MFDRAATFATRSLRAISNFSMGEIHEQEHGCEFGDAGTCACGVG
jgi:hypothetical protein